MRFGLLCKRRYTHKDLLDDRFGRLFHLPLELSRLGFAGRVIAADYSSAESQTVSLPQLSLVSVPLSPLRGPAFLRETCRHLGQFRPDVLIASGDIHFGLLGLAFARRFGIPFAFDVYDDYSAFAAGRLPGMKTAFHYVLRRADLVVCASDPLRARVNSRARQALVVENGVDPGVFRPLPRADARRVAGIPMDETVIGFFGSIERSRGVETLLEAFAVLQRARSAMRLLIAGTRNLPLDLTGPGVDVRGAVPQEEIPALLSACDVAVIPYWPDPQVDVSGPCKIAEYLACGVPVVATRVSNLPAWFRESPAGLCAPHDVPDMVRAICAQLDKPVRVPFPDRLAWTRLGGALAGALCALVSGSCSCSTGVENRMR